MTAADPVEVSEKSWRNSMLAARQAQREWAETSVEIRCKIIRRWRALLAMEAPKLASASVGHRTRPEGEVLTSEIIPLADACHFLEKNAERLMSPRRVGRPGRPLWLGRIRSEVRREPFGVVLIIGPGNYPLFLVGVQVAQALVAGNAVWLKPAPEGNSAAHLLVELLGRAGLDKRLIAILPESKTAAREAIECRPDKIIFTGSAITGQSIGELAGRLLIPTTLELSGCDAVIVRADADIKLAAKALAFGLRLNGGLTCIAPRRVFVNRRIVRQLEAELLNFLDGDGHRKTSTSSSGPRDSINEVLLGDAVDQGASVLKASEDALVLTNVPRYAGILREAPFGPILSIVPVDSDEEASEAANESEFGLGASIFSRSIQANDRTVRNLSVGVVTINDLILPTADPRLPFGGKGRSGFGVTRGEEGLLEMTRAKVVSQNYSTFRPAFDPIQPNDTALFYAFVEFFHGSGVRRLRGLMNLMKALAGRFKK